MRFRSIFTEPVKPPHPIYRYTMLGTMLFLLVESMEILLSLPPGWAGPRYMSVVLGLSMLFCLLAFEFKWPTRVRVAWRILALSSAILAMFYFLYINTVLGGP
jgi:hypothetical protein